MPCTNPQTIYNRSTFLNRIAGYLTQEVPCGKCEECKSFKRIEWVFRAYYEWLECVNNGGFALFDTLTYNPTSLETRTKYGISCFSREDLRNFIKKMNRRMSSSGYNFRYLITCEYGEQKHRPHYHVLLFITPFPSDYKMSNIWHATRVNKIISTCWTEQETDKEGNLKYWIDSKSNIHPKMRSLGFNDTPSKAIGHIVNRTDGLRYVTKYITKDDDYYLQLLDMKNLLLRGMDTESVIDEIVDWFEKAKPFHCQSLGFGSCALKFLETIKDDIIQNPVAKVLAIDKYPIPIPMYYLRKMFYTLEQSGLTSPTTGKPLYRWKLTSLGKLFKSIQIEKRIERYSHIYKNLCDNAPSYDELEGELHRQYINELMFNRSWYDYSLYRIVFKGHFNNNLPYVETLDNWQQFYLKSLDDGEEESYINTEYSLKKINYIKTLKQNVINDTFHPSWENFDEITNILKKIQQKKNIHSSIESEKIKKIHYNLSILRPD